MDYLSVLTSAGVIAFRGRIHTGPPRPSLLMVTGAFAPKGQHQELIDWFPGANVLVARLPGMGLPPSDSDAAKLTAGLEEATQLLFRDWPVVVCGGSASGLVTIPLRVKNIHRKVILEPFLTTEPLWPFLEYARTQLRRDPANEALRRYLWTMFGFGAEVAENRDYRSLIDAIDVPTDVVVGGMPLHPRRPLPDFPSLTSVEDRAILRAHPMVTMHEGPLDSGHNLWSNGDTARTIRGLLLAALHSAAKLL